MLQNYTHTETYKSKVLFLWSLISASMGKKFTHFVNKINQFSNHPTYMAHIQSKKLDIKITIQKEGLLPMRKIIGFIAAIKLFNSDGVKTRRMEICRSFYCVDT